MSFEEQRMEAAASSERPPVAGVTDLLQALGDPVRMAIVRALAAASPEPICCGQFGVTVTKSTLSHHFRVLRDAGVIDGRHVGTRKLLSLRRQDLDQAYPGLLDSLLRAPAEPAPPELEVILGVTSASPR
ncbi:MAG: ArsR/SmtB family transcription factor [Candidatus Dormibacteria bacterium]